MITIGTAHFVSMRAAVRYYLPYGNDRAEIRRKFIDGEFFVGFPPTQPGDIVTVIDRGTRYAVTSGRR